MLAVPIGGRYPDGFEISVNSSTIHPPVTHVFEASTGREVHRVLGLSRRPARPTWTATASSTSGARPTASSAPSAARRPNAGAPRDVPADPGRREGTGDNDIANADLDADGVSDALIGDLHAPGYGGRKPGSRTAIARSGRDGRLLWKSVLDPPRVWFDRDRGESFGLSVAPLPDGDLDGDGTPDVARAQIPVARVLGSARAGPPPCPCTPSPAGPAVRSGPPGRCRWGSGRTAILKSSRSSSIASSRALRPTSSCAT